ncbi:MAG: DNA-directed DNA polymerase II small subunit [Candidatus Brockarchaeota archaeon]|nr:DNA-directed DNA polymerase II small subunit [Candidatus Brockarchaeota archaeon]
MENEAVKRLILDKLSSKGLVVDSAALDYLASTEGIGLGEFIDYVAKSVGDSTIFLSQKTLEEVMRSFMEGKPKINSMPVTTQEGGKSAEATYIASDLKVLLNIEKTSNPSDEVESKRAYLADRFKKLERILRSRLDVTGVCSIVEARKSADKTRLKVIAMVSEVKTENYVLIEDLQGSAYLIIPQSASEGLRAKARRLHADLVACFEIVVLGGKFICLDITFPDLPETKPNRSAEPVCAALISDLHVGSRYFMDKAFQLFLDWLNGRVGSPATRQVAGKVKYVVIAGDLVDGVGVYPQQEKELSIKNVKTQYEKAAELLRRIPKHVEIIIIPGNHDATQKALPQPPIPEEYSAPLLDSGNVTLLSNPSLVSLHGVKFLLTHGTSIEDLASRIPGLDYSNPHQAMIHLLVARHLAPIYGGRTPLNTDGEDALVITDKPDVFHAGHVHVYKVGGYRGVVVANTGCWQRMTPYQQALGYVPTPGIFSLVHLDTLATETVPILAEARQPD